MVVMGRRLQAGVALKLESGQMKASRYFKETTNRTILFRQNVNRSNEAWAKFLKDYKDALIAWDMKEFGDDIHTAEDIVMEIYLNIIVDPVITNLVPDQSFRSTLIFLCKKKHSSVTKPWRNGLKRKLAEWQIISRPSPGDIYLETKLGVGQLVINDLLNREKDGSRSYLTFSPTNLRHWRKMWEAGADAKNQDVAKSLKISGSVLSKSCAKVNDFIVSTTDEILKRRGFK